MLDPLADSEFMGFLMQFWKLTKKLDISFIPSDLNLCTLYSGLAYVIEYLTHSLKSAFIALFVCLCAFAINVAEHVCELEFLHQGNFYKFVYMRIWSVKMLHFKTWFKESIAWKIHLTCYLILIKPTFFWRPVNK